MNFKRPFVLGSFDKELPAGAYVVETDEELLEGLSFPAYRRILTVLRLHPTSAHSGLTQTLTIDPNELTAALGRDQALANTAAAGSNDQSSLEDPTGIRLNAADHPAIGRAEDEGTIGHPK